MTFSSEAFARYKAVVEHFYDRDYLEYEEQLASFKTDPLYAELDRTNKFDLELYLAMGSYRQNQFQACADTITQIRTDAQLQPLSDHQNLQLLTIEAEMEMKLRHFDSAQALFEKAVVLADESYTYEDVTQRWEQALDELELSYQKPEFLESIKQRWAQIKAKYKL